MNIVQDCPFCLPSKEDKIILETPYARAMCDARPIIIGHILVVSAEHIPSAFDVSGIALAHLQIVQQEISHRIHSRFGQVGVYEHGRSMLCRFHDANRGHTHAHLHVLPVSSDLLNQSGYEFVWGERPSMCEITENDRYLYQEIGEYPRNSWAIGTLPVRRHFVRTHLEEVLAEKGKQWISLESSPDDHDDAVSATAEILGASDKEPELKIIALFGSLESSAKTEIAKVLQTALGSQGRIVLDSELGKSTETETALRVWLLDKAESATPSFAPLHQETAIPSKISAGVLPSWNDLRVTISSLAPDQILEILNTAWQLRFGRALF